MSGAGFAAALVAILLSGVPIAFGLGLFSLAVLHFVFRIPLHTVPSSLVGNLDSFTLLALPFFTLGAHFMMSGGIAKRIISVAEAYLGHLPGGLALATVAASMLFAGITGSSVADAVAIGLITIPEMTRLGYPKSFAVGLVACAGTLGILIPPSATMIIYGYITNTSVGQLFMAGLIPGITLGLALMLTAYVIARRQRYPTRPRVSWAERWKVTWHATPALLMPVLILGGIYSGVFTPTESAAVAALYALLVSLFVYRTVKLNEILTISARALLPTGMIMFIITNALLFGQVLLLSRIPQNFANAVASSGVDTWVVVLLTLALLLVLGCFMESASMILVVIPVLFPALVATGVDPLQFGVMLVVAVEIGLVTPPVGMNLYAVSSIARTPLIVGVRGMLPFLAVMCVYLGVVTAIPQLSTWLPRLMFAR